jgi:molecular chaperone DnaK (HSP70)
MDASVIQIKELKDFQIISNIGDNSFGLNDVNERIVKHIIQEKRGRQAKSGKQLTSRTYAEALNTHSNLIEALKVRIQVDDQAGVDLTTMSEVSVSQARKIPEGLVISKRQLMESVCKDVYDWSMVHVDKAEKQAHLADGAIDEIIVIGGPEKMPGFFDQLKSSHPNKKITFVTDNELSVGAAIVVGEILSLV